MRGPHFDDVPTWYSSVRMHVEWVRLRMQVHLALIREPKISVKSRWSLLSIHLESVSPQMQPLTSAMSRGRRENGAGKHFESISG